MQAVFTAINARYIHSSYASLALRAYLLENQCPGDTMIREFSLNDPLETVLSGLFQESADIYLFPAYVFNIGRVLETCAALKAMLPDCKIILGGPEVSYDAQAQLQTHGFIDAVICGEGEEPLLELLRNLHAGKSFCGIPGVALREGRQPLSPPPPLPMRAIPFPYRYADMADFRHRIVYYETARGCPYRCAYCMSSIGQGVRYKDLETVQKELAFFVKHGVPLVKLTDRTFNADPARAREIFKMVMALPPGTAFHFELAGHLLDADTLDLLKDAPPGRMQFEIGVQTTHAESLRAIERHTDIPALIKAVGVLTARRCIPVHLDLIAGLPEDTLEHCAEAFNTCMNLMPARLHLGFLKLLKGSALRRNHELYGMRFSAYPPYEVRGTRHITAAELQCVKHVAEALDHYYNSGNFQASMYYILPRVQDAFEFFKQLSGQPGGFEHRRIEQPLEILYEVAQRHGLSNIEELCACLRYDYLLLNKRGQIPPFLRPDTLTVAGQRKTHTERFVIDMPELMRSGNVAPRPVILRFDYALPKARRVDTMS